MTSMIFGGGVHPRNRKYIFKLDWP